MAKNELELWIRSNILEIIILILVLILLFNHLKEGKTEAGPIEEQPLENIEEEPPIVQPPAESVTQDGAEKPAEEAVT